MKQISGHLDETKSHSPSSWSQLLRPGSGQLFSITNQLHYGLVLFVGLSLLTGGILIYLSFVAQREQLVAVERERSRAAAGDINAYLDDLQRKLAYLARVPGLADLSPEIQQDLLQGLVRHNDAYRTIAILDHTGQVVTAISSEGVPVSLDNQAGSLLFSRTFERAGEFVGPVELDPVTRQPVVTLAVPIRNRQDEVAGVLLAQVDLNFLWFIISQVNVGKTGYAYVLDNRNVLIAQKGSDPETFNREDISDRPFIQNLLSGSTENFTTYVGLNGVEVLGAIAPIPSVSWNVVVELPTAEAYAPVRNMLTVMGVALMIAILLAVGLGILIGRQVVTPLQRLTEASQRFGAGDMASRVDIASRNEMGVLATTFNEMMTRIGHLVLGLEDRTRRLEIIATLSERLTAILDLQELLAEVVNQIKDNFNYYHVHIYLLDEVKERLIIAEGIGFAGAEMKAKGHNIPLNAPASLVARAARTGEIVRVDNVREAEDWLPNPLLPNTYSEMAVPISLEGQVVGVLDVQQDKIAGLDDGDANLLRSLANQVAVAIRNARQFATVEAALVEAHALQRQYLAQAWDRTRVTRKSVGRVQFSLGESTTLGEGIIASAQQQVLSHQKPAVVALIGQPDGTRHALVAPVMLRDVMIGDLQLHGIEPDRAWAESELALINAVIDQVAQTAENLRLLDETQERASREQLVSQISNKMRHAPDMESLLKVAVAELARVLDPVRTFVRLDSEATLSVAPREIAGNGGSLQPEVDQT